MNQTPGNGTAGDGGAGCGPQAAAPPAGSQDAASAETTRPEGAGAADTIADQAALHGVLQRVRDLGLPLVSVTRVDADQSRP